MTNHHADLERRVDRRLRQLPQPRAPQTLLPRVLEAVRVAAVRPWYVRRWLTWPLAWQAASVVVLLAVVAAAGVWWPALADAWTTMTAGPLALASTWSTRVIDRSDVVLTAIHVLWRACVQPLAPYLVVFIAVMSAACMVFGLALNRLTLRGVVQS